MFWIIIKTLLNFIMFSIEWICELSFEEIIYFDHFFYKKYNKIKNIYCDHAKGKFLFEQIQNGSWKQYFY